MQRFAILLYISHLKWEEVVRWKVPNLRDNFPFPIFSAFFYTKVLRKKTNFDFYSSYRPTSKRVGKSK